MDKKMNNKQINTIKLTDKHLHFNYNFIYRKQREKMICFNTKEN